jgi:hypothetical protein
MDPPQDENKNDEERRKRWWLRQWKRCERLIGPVLWLLARLIDRAINHTHHG